MVPSPSARSSTARTWPWSGSKWRSDARLAITDGCPARPPMTDPLRRRLPRVGLALLAVAGVAAFVFFGPSEPEILSHQAAWKADVRENLLLALLIFFVVEVIL